MSEIKSKIEYLSGFTSPRRLSLLEDVLSSRTSYMRVCMENIYYSQNASAVIRSAESFGVQHIDIIEDELPFVQNADIVRGTDKWVSMHRYDQQGASLELITKLKSQGYRVVATSPHEGDFTPEDFDISQPFAIFFGTEKQGISQVVEQNADAFIRIPMFGFVESLNISVCAAVIMQRLMTRLRESSYPWQLSEKEYDELLLEWLHKTIKDADGILENYQERLSGSYKREGSLSDYLVQNYKK